MTTPTRRPAMTTPATPTKRPPPAKGIADLDQRIVDKECEEYGEFRLQTQREHGDRMQRLPPRDQSTELRLFIQTQANAYRKFVDHVVLFPGTSIVLNGAPQELVTDPLNGKLRLQKKGNDHW